MTYIENIDKIRIVVEAARHIYMQTFPMDMSWGSIPCLTQWVCPTWVADGSDGLPPDVLIFLLNSPWRCSQSLILLWAPCRDRTEEKWKMVCGSPIYFVLYGSNVNTELILSLAPYTAETRRVKATFIIFRGRYSMEITLPYYGILCEKS